MTQWDWGPYDFRDAENTKFDFEKKQNKTKMQNVVEFAEIYKNQGFLCNSDAFFHIKQKKTMLTAF